MLKLDIGCGGRGTMYPDFIGIDIHPIPEKPRNNNAIYLRLDFVNGDLPWNKGTVDEIVAIHIIEHLDYEEGQILLRRAYDLLKPGAKMRISCPNLEFNARMYLAAKQGDEYAIGYWNRRYSRTGKPYFKGDTFADRLMHQIREDTHIWQYDQESLIKAAEKAGCKNIEPMPWGHEWNKRREYENEEIGIIVTKGEV